MNPEHQQAQELSMRAALCLKESNVIEARRLFAEAAELERAALAKVPPDKSRTRGILAVSLVALLYKSGDYKAAERQIYLLLHGDEKVPNTTRSQLKEILLKVRGKRREVSSAEGARILIVDDDPSWQKEIARIVRKHQEDAEIITVGSKKEASEILIYQSIDQVVLDQKIPDQRGGEADSKHGRELSNWIKQNYGRERVFGYTGHMPNTDFVDKYHLEAPLGEFLSSRSPEARS